MNKIEITLSQAVEKLKSFYEPEKHHFLTLNGVALDKEHTEIQWIFCEYGKIDHTTIFYCVVKQDDVIPSITEFIPSAIISQREIVDMFGIVVEGSEQGLYLDEDSLQKPLSLSSGCSL
jgi:Ni,Fe-hydrogenase III component G